MGCGSAGDRLTDETATNLILVAASVNECCGSWQWAGLCRLLSRNRYNDHLSFKIMSERSLLSWVMGLSPFRISDGGDQK
jgi:hypothetical protein